MLPDCTSQSFAARFAELPNVMAFVRRACADAGFSEEAMRRVELVVEEAFSNSILHGYDGEQNDGEVWLSSRALADGIALVYADAAPAFNPLLDAAPHDIEAIGGIGCALIRTLPRRVAYRREEPRNVLTLEFARSAG